MGVQPTEILPTGSVQVNFRYRVARNCNVTLARPDFTQENPVRQYAKDQFTLRLIAKTNLMAKPSRVFRHRMDDILFLRKVNF